MTVASTTLTSQGYASWAYLAKLSSSGTPLWIQQIGPGGNANAADDNQLRDVVVDASSNEVYIVGTQGSNPLAVGE